MNHFIPSFFYLFHIVFFYLAYFLHPSLASLFQFLLFLPLLFLLSFNFSLSLIFRFCLSFPPSSSSAAAAIFLLPFLYVAYDHVCKFYKCTNILSAFNSNANASLENQYSKRRFLPALKDCYMHES